MELKILPHDERTYYIDKLLLPKYIKSKMFNIVNKYNCFHNYVYVCGPAPYTHQGGLNNELNEPTYLIIMPKFDIIIHVYIFMNNIYIHKYITYSSKCNTIGNNISTYVYDYNNELCIAIYYNANDIYDNGRAINILKNVEKDINCDMECKRYTYNDVDDFYIASSCVNKCFTDIISNKQILSDIMFIIGRRYSDYTMYSDQSNINKLKEAICSPYYKSYRNETKYVDLLY